MLIVTAQPLLKITVRLNVSTELFTERWQASSLVILQRHAFWTILRDIRDLTQFCGIVRLNTTSLAVISPASLHHEQCCPTSLWQAGILLRSVSGRANKSRIILSGTVKSIFTKEEVVAVGYQDQGYWWPFNKSGQGSQAGEDLDSEMKRQLKTRLGVGSIQDGRIRVMSKPMLTLRMQAPGADPLTACVRWKSISWYEAFCGSCKHHCSTAWPLTSK